MLGLCHRQYLGPSPAAGPATPAEVVAGLLGLTLDALFLGSSATDVITGTTLLASGATPAKIDQLMLAMIEGEPPPILATTGYQFDAPDDALTAPANPELTPPNDHDFLDGGPGSQLVLITFRPDSPSALRSLVGKTDATDGIELLYSSTEKVQCNARIGGVTTFLELAGTHPFGQTHTVGCLVDRSTDELILGTVRPGVGFGESEAEKRIALPAGSLSNLTVPFSLGNGRITAFDGQIAHVVVASGTQVEGRSPKLMARELAELSWWDDVRGSITP